MGKVKSAIITALLVAAIIVAAFFATISYPIGSTQRYNSIASSIHMGADYTGNAYATLYPENVISAQDYKFLTDDEASEYKQVGGVYVKTTEDVSALSEQVNADAAIINQRLSKKGYSSYSVSVEDGLSIKVSVPTNYSYAAYKGNNSTTLSDDLTVATSAITALTVSGDITLRTTERTITTVSDDDDETETVHTINKDSHTETALVSGSETYSLTKVTEDVNTFFKSVTSRTIGSTSVISLNLTKVGRERMKDITTLIASSDSQVLYIFMGDTQVLSVSCTSTINLKKLQLQADDQETAQNCAIALNSAVKGNALSVTYSDISDVVESTAVAGDNAAMFMGIASLLVLVVAAVLLIVKYKKLGIVATLSAVIFALAIVYALYLIEIQLTFVGLLTAFVGLALSIASNVIVFENIRKHTAVGKTMQSSIKAGYKDTLMTVADIHIVLFVVAILLAFVGAGEVASCGLILVISTIASYVIYWFTRFMWYVLSSPVRDKFKFGGYKRVVYDD